MEQRERQDERETLGESEQDQRRCMANHAAGGNERLREAVANVAGGQNADDGCEVVMTATTPAAASRGTFPCDTR
jgi:hypothetical protein